MWWGAGLIRLLRLVTEENAGNGSIGRWCALGCIHLKATRALSRVQSARTGDVKWLCFVHQLLLLPVGFSWPVVSAEQTQPLRSSSITGTAQPIGSPAARSAYRGERIGS
jgi:hypothetical protein